MLSRLTLTDNDLLGTHTQQIEHLMSLLAELSGRPVATSTTIVETKTGSGPDMESLKAIFASKLPPDNTIKRIEALE